MKTNRIINMLIAIIAVCTLSGCGSEQANKLLSTVPSDAVVVATLNGSKIADNAGCKISGSKVTFSDKVKSQMKGASNREFIELLENGDLGMKMETVVFFMIGSGKGYVTMEIESQDKFIEGTKKVEDSDLEFDKEGDFMVSREVIVGKDQVWIASGRADLDDIEGFVSLKEEESMVASPLAAKLADMNHAANVVMNLEEGLDMARMAGVGRSQLSMMRMALNTLYEKSNYISFAVDLDGKELEFIGEVLDRDGNPAKFLMDIPKINTSSVGALQTNGEVFFAMGVDQDLINKLVGLAGPAGIPDMMEDALKAVDGTVAMAMGKHGSMKVGIDCKEVNDVVKQMANIHAGEMGGTATVDGDRVFMTSANEPNGKITSRKAADDLDDAFIGLVFYNEESRSNPELTGIIKMKKSGDSAILKGKIETTGKFLETFIKN